MTLVAPSSCRGSVESLVPLGHVVVLRPGFAAPSMSCGHNLVMVDIGVRPWTDACSLQHEASLILTIIIILTFALRLYS